MKKLIVTVIGGTVYLIVILLVEAVGGCAPSFCDSASPDYDLQSCQQWRLEFQRQWNENIQRERDRNAYGNPYPRIIPLSPPQSPTYIIQPTPRPGVWIATPQ